METLLHTLFLHPITAPCGPTKNHSSRSNPLSLISRCCGLALLVIPLIFNAGCATSTKGLFSDTDVELAQDIRTEDGPISESEQPDDLPSTPMTEQTLFNLLVGELAYQERKLPLAVNKYLGEALKTRDPAIAEHAARLAYFGREREAALSAANLWYELDSNNERAANLYADLIAKSGDPLGTVKLFRSQLEKNQKPNFEILLSARYPKEEAEQDIILDEIGKLLEDYPNHNSLVYTYAILLQKKQRHQPALDLIQNQHTNTAEVRVILLRSQLLQQLNQKKRALKLIEKANKTHPEEDSLQRYYAQLLTLDANTLGQAEKQLHKLVQVHPNDSELVRSHSLIAFENKHFDAAANSANELIRLGKYSDAGHYLLGEIALVNDNLPQAERHFGEVQPGQYYLSAIQQIVDVLDQQNHLDRAREYLAQLRNEHPLQAPNFWVMESNLLKKNDLSIEAHSLLSDAIARLPEQLLLRIERSFISETFGDIEMTEADLRFVLERDPDNVIALNALGYSLSNKTTRYDEALALVEQAIAIRPNDPAIIDSLGWVQFRLGDTESALKNLKRAYDQYPDDEIAAHLIEVYWTINKKRAAKSIIKKIKRQEKPYPLVLKTAERLGIKH